MVGQGKGDDGADFGSWREELRALGRLRALRAVVWACDDTGPQREADVYTLDDGELDDCFTSFDTWDVDHDRPSVAWLASDLVNAACEHLEATGR